MDEDPKIEDAPTSKFTIKLKGYNFNQLIVTNANLALILVHVNRHHLYRKEYH